MLPLILVGFFGASTAQFVSQPPGYAMNQFNSPFGSVDSHPGYAAQQKYVQDYHSRTVITAPQGNVVQVGIDVTDKTAFCIRSYDFAVMWNCADDAKIKNPCTISNYSALGTKDVDYVSVTMANTAQPRRFVSKTNQACLDFCVDKFDPKNDPASCMKGFRAIWMSFPPQTAPVTPAPPTADPGPIPTPAPDFVVRPGPVAPQPNVDFVARQ